MPAEPRPSLRRPSWHALRSMAAEHHGVLTTTDWLDAGLTQSALSRAVSRAELVRLAPRTFAVPSLLDRWSHLAAACASTAGAVASHRAAALLLGLDGIEEEVVEVTVASGRGRRWPNVHRSSDLHPSDVVTVDAIHTTDAARTLCDLGATCDDAAVERAVESALRLRLTTLPRLEARCAALSRRGRAGPPALRRVLGLRVSAAPTESALETLAVQCLRAGGVPEPVRQHVIRHEGRFVARVDLAWPAARVYLELDSERHHGTWAARRHDLARQNRLTAAGWAPLRHTWADFANGGEEAAAAVATVIAERSAA